MGNNDVCKIVGIGEVHLETEVGCRLILKNVRHVPDLRLNLISIGKLDDDGFYSSFANGTWRLSKHSLVVAKGKKCCSLYKSMMQLCKGEMNVSEGDLTADLWHTRLGHMSAKGMEILARKDKLPKLKGMPLYTCTHCLVGKPKRVSFHKSSSYKKSNVLELIHSDVCGPMSTKTIGGALYFVTFIDDHSRKLWCYAMKTKDEVSEIFQSFHVEIERETGRTLKCLRSDNGGEYIGALEAYCKSKWIRHEQSVPKTPQHNGVAERMNHTIMERVRCMLSHAKLSKSFWGEAMNTVVYLINQSPSAPLNGDVPPNVWQGKEVSYDHLRVFSCQALVHVPKDERKKLDDKAKECIFVGYGDEKFGFRLWDLKVKKLIRSQDVTFLENQTIEHCGKFEDQQPHVEEYSEVDNPFSSTANEDVEDHS